MKDVLLTVSGVIAEDIVVQIERGERPKTDYVAMARTFEADVVDYGLARQRNGRIGKLLEKIGGPNLLLAWDCFRQQKKYQVIFTDGEQVGLPLAFLLKFTFSRRRPAHLMITHILSVPKKQILLDALRLHHQIDVFFVYATRQKEFIENRWQVPSSCVVYTPFMVDAEFFQAAKAGVGNAMLQEISRDPRPIICSVGLEFRDYPTLLEAVKELDVQVVIAAASPWSKRDDTTTGRDIPDNVTVSRFTQYELRDLYGLSAFMVMPLYDVQFQAGVTALLEAMAMSKAVVCSRTLGQTDVIIDNENGIYVPPGDVEALKTTIVQLLTDPSLYNKLGENGRLLIEKEMSLTRYVERLNMYIQQARSHQKTSPRS